MRLSVIVLAVLAAVPASAAAAPLPDRVLAEVSTPLAVGIDGTTVAYTHRIGKRKVELVVRREGAPVRRIPAGRGPSPVDVGRDRRGRRIVVYVRCGRRCDVLALPAQGGRSRVIAGVRRAADVTIGANRVFWTDGLRVRSRSLDGGPVRSEAFGGEMKPTALDTDGRTLAVTGDTRFPAGEGGTQLTVTRPGSGRARFLEDRDYTEAYVEYRSPVVTRAGVTTLYEDDEPGVATSFADFASGKDTTKFRGTGEMLILDWDASGDRAVFIQGSSLRGGCDFTYEDFDTGDLKKELEAPCRIVQADLRGERLLPPDFASCAGSDPTNFICTVSRAVVQRGGSITAQVPQPGVVVEMRQGPRLLFRSTTDARGRVRLPNLEGVTIIARTDPPTYSFN